MKRFSENVPLSFREMNLVRKEQQSSDSDPDVPSKFPELKKMRSSENSAGGCSDTSLSLIEKKELSVHQDMPEGSGSG